MSGKRTFKRRSGRLARFTGWFKANILPIKHPLTDEDVRVIARKSFYMGYDFAKQKARDIPSNDEIEKDESLLEQLKIKLLNRRKKG